LNEPFDKLYTFLTIGIPSFIKHFPKYRESYAIKS